MKSKRRPRQSYLNLISVILRPRQRILKLFLTFIIILLLGGVYFYYRNSKKDSADPAELKILDILALAKNKEAIRPVIKKFGLESIMKELVYKSGGGSVFDCHQEAHNIGRAGYEIEKEKAFGECDASCHSGCYHGAMEEFLKEKGTKNLAADIDAVCKTFSTSFGVFECLHGVGHGVLAYVDYNLPEAIEECRKLSTNFARDSCYGGMFMENILTGQGLGAAKGTGEGLHETKWVNKNDPHFPCDKISQDDALQVQCYQMQTSWMLTVYSYDFDKVAKECRNAPDNMVSICYRSYGRDAAGHTLRNTIKILDLCDKVSKDYYNDCVYGALNVIVDFWGPELRGQAAELCNLTPTFAKENCWSTLAWRITDVFKDPATQKMRCDEFEGAYRHLCSK